MSKIWPQGSSEGEVFRDDDEMGVYKPSDAPAIADGSQNKKKTLLSLREWLSTALASLSTGFVTLTGLLTVSGNGITSSTTTIDMQKSVTIQGMSGSVDSRIETNTTNISANDGDIVSVNGRVDTNDADILILDGRVDGNDTDIGNNAGAITALENLQPTETTDNVTFLTVNTGYGANEVVPEDLYTNKITSGTATLTLATVALKQTGHVVYRATGNIDIKLPVTGNFSYTILASFVGSSDSAVSVSGGTVILSMISTQFALISYKRIS